MYPTTVIGIMYGIYILLVLTVMGWFVYALTHEKKIGLGFKFSITAWIALLVLGVITFHTFIHIKFPWTRWQVLGKAIAPKKVVTINISEYAFHLPENPIILKVNEPVKFRLFSQDVTYGFGVFRSDGTLVFQMQVLPGRANEILWFFQNEGRYTIRSTEYSGPENWRMVLKDAIVVTE